MLKKTGSGFKEPGEVSGEEMILSDGFKAFLDILLTEAVREDLESLKNEEAVQCRGEEKIT